MVVLFGVIPNGANESVSSDYHFCPPDPVVPRPVGQDSSGAVGRQYGNQLLGLVPVSQWCELRPSTSLASSKSMLLAMDTPRASEWSGRTVELSSNKSTPSSW